ncbi:MarR family transcriptional regulator [Mycobacterium timonense]|uniref:MarR family transcriptional regulator n=2 Tax=Mycobacterium avium complex (MAC) TaxID=120793 RepID=A0AAW5S9G4_MYCBC|nr:MULTISPECIES: MarR family transcriptional regulator [Mycobacterium avium complex (MAC)]MCA2292844.1 MarR family transcriptional regulator [Mycobacterium avium]MCV6991590.1 MarR family transcriptional regulator [Mycobacterium bouchedurhonense]MCV6994993.1 MarR family transcriptional regulator [Mycobacterium timonense]ORA41938.1 MarR family transcriptional regulator [Mycobacterium bouchedurhonense]ORB77166.1 MarR family transcriptional regulator [Mycobacterium timonense]
MTELKVLQAVRLKGRIAEADLPATVGADPAQVTTTVEKLTQSGMLVNGKMLRISPGGRERLNVLLAAERATINPEAIAAAYDDFRGVNADFKALVSDWQVKDGEPNTHLDIGYDAAVLKRLDRVHQKVMPIIATAATQVPRLVSYAAKLEGALGKLKAGDVAWLTRPIIDSYHTVWFELHEELILLTGLTREDEAKAGHAQ